MARHRHNKNHHPPHHVHRRIRYVLLTVQGVTVLLSPHMELFMSTVLTIGHKLNLSIAYLDQNGNPMLVTPALDANPVWANSDAGVETLSVSGDGLSATGTPVAPGNDTVSLSVTAGGQTFSAILAVEVDPAPQVLTSIEIVPSVE
jgi:hypothetical protein